METVVSLLIDFLNGLKCQVVGGYHLWTEVQDSQFLPKLNQIYIQFLHKNTIQNKSLDKYLEGLFF